jgi:hypothetical protein
MNPFLCHLCAGFLSLSSLAANDTTKLLAPSAYEQIQAGTPCDRVTDLLGPSDHGKVALRFGIIFGDGPARPCIYVAVEATWETGYGTISVKCVDGEVTEKSFRPNLGGIKEVLCQLPALVNLRTTLPLDLRTLPLDR